MTEDRGSRNRSPALLAAMALLWAAQSASAGDEAAMVLARVQAWLDGTKDLQAGFTQTLVSGALGAGLEESGAMYLERPGRMRWDYLEPERKIALVNDQRTTLYLIEDAQLIRGRLDSESDLLPTLLAGQARVADRFEATLLATPDIGGEGAYRLRLAPRANHAVQPLLNLHREAVGLTSEHEGRRPVADPS